MPKTIPVSSMHINKYVYDLYRSRIKNQKLSSHDVNAILKVFSKKLIKDLENDDIFIPNFGMLRLRGKSFRIRLTKKIEKLIMKSLK
jgi:nucleoid DNA-binding protein